MCMHMLAHMGRYTCTRVPTHTLTKMCIYMLMHVPGYTVAFREALAAPQTKRGLRQLTPLLLVSAGTPERGERPWLTPDPSPAGLRPRDRRSAELRAALPGEAPSGPTVSVARTHSANSTAPRVLLF